tara:strand:- start:40110 stop:40889 length:780 start_codon:yes stop_codon:yes gene_type:complete
MSSIKNLPSSLQKSLSQCSLLKIIAGLNNFDKISVSRISSAAGCGGADLLDVACDPELVKLAVENSNIPVCVSSVEPHLFPAAIDAGASMVEIGNFDSFYPQGRFFDADEVKTLTLKTKELLPNAALSVTVPHILPLDQQCQLALDLIEIGADLIQTEGGTSAKPFSPGSLGLIEKAAPTLAATQSIFETIKNSNRHVPLICASGLSSVTLPMAFAVGASGVGVGSAINRLQTELEMLAVIRKLRESIISFNCLSQKVL